MVQKYYSSPKNTPLTKDEIKEKYEDIHEEMKEVLEWKKEEKAKLKSSKTTSKEKEAAKKDLKKIARRINTVKGQIIYWELREKGESNFKANLEKNEFWASCKEE